MTKYLIKYNEINIQKYLFIHIKIIIICNFDYFYIIFFYLNKNN